MFHTPSGVAVFYGRPPLNFVAHRSIPDRISHPLLHNKSAFVAKRLETTSSPGRAGTSPRKEVRSPAEFLPTTPAYADWLIEHLQDSLRSPIRRIHTASP